MHNWTIEDDLVAMYIALYGNNDLSNDINSISKKLAIKPTSMKMRISNFHAIIGKTGLNHYAKQSLKVYNKFSMYDKSQLLSVVKEILK